MRRAAIAGLVGVFVLLVAGGSAASSAPAKAHLYWQTGITPVLPSDAATGSANIDSVSCASPGNCSAVGDYVDRSKVGHGLLLTETSGRWAAGVKAQLPANADPASSLGLSIHSVSCSSPGNCSAAGYYTDDSGNIQGLLLTETAGVWGAGVEAAMPADAMTTGQLVFLNSVSCPSDGDCTAVGEYNINGNSPGVLLTETAGTWSTGEEAVTPGGAPVLEVKSVSCPSSGNCTAVGEYIDDSGILQGLMLTETAGVWGTGVESILPANASATEDVYLNSVSCASPGNCSAVGHYNDHGEYGDGLLLTEQAGVWEPGIEAPAPNAAPYGVELAAVSCASAGNCAAVGTLVLNETAGVWSNGSDAALFGELRSVSCAAPGSCSAAGDDLLVTEAAGRWKATIPPLPSNHSSASTQLVSVSCPATRYCTAVGSLYTPATDAEDGLIVDGTPIQPCVVPKLKGRSLVAAKRSIKSHGCAVGKIERVRSRTTRRGHVISQRPKFGRTLRHGTKVNLRVSSG